MATTRKNTTKAALVSTLTLVERFNPPMDGKYIAYDRITRDYACFLDGRYICHAPNHIDGETELNRVSLDQLTHTYSISADIAAELADYADRWDADIIRGVRFTVA